MATQIEELESIPATKPEREDKELLNEVTSIDFSPDEVKKLGSKPNQGESFLKSPLIPEVTTNDSSSTPKEYEATKIKDKAEEFEIQTPKEEILKDQNIEIVASKETSDEQRMITEEKLEESQGDEREHVMDELAQGGTLSESSSIKAKEVWLNDKENEGPNVDDTDESTTKQIAKKENFKYPLLESTGEETVSYSQEENATEQGGKIESFGAIEDTTEFKKVENKIDSQDLASNEDDIIAKNTQEDETTKERLEQEVLKKSSEGTAEIEVQVIDEDNTSNFEPSAGEEINEANLKREQKESDIEANRINKEIEEQKTEERASNSDLPSTATGEEIVAEYLKEDETDEVKPKEEVKNLETESIQNTDTKCHVEEEIHPKESNEILVVSSLMPQVSQKETEDDNLDKEESATTELMEERSIKEVEKESNNSHLLLEEKSRAIEVGSDDVNIKAEHSEVTEIVSYSHEEDATEQKGAEIESFYSIEDITEVEKVENKSDSQLESNTDDITAKDSQEGPEEEAPRIRIGENAEKAAQIIEEDKTESFGPSADEESNEANLKMEQKESDIEANRTNKEIEEQKTEERASKTDLLSTATKDEIAVEYLKEDEVKNLETEIIQNTHTTRHVEEEIHQKETKEDLGVSSSMPQVSQKGAEDDNLDKKESAITELMEERSIKEVEKESNNSDQLLEEKSRVIEVEKVENKSDSQVLESNMDDITAKSSQEDGKAKEGPKEEVPRIKIEEAAEKEAHITKEDNTANFGPSPDEQSNEENLKMEQKESDLEANSTNEDIEEQKTEESATKADLLSTATEKDIDVEYLKEDETDEVKPNEEVKNLEGDNLDKSKPVITEFIEERSLKEVEQESKNSDLILEDKSYATIPKDENERELTSGEMSISYLLEQTLEESLAPSKTESQLGGTPEVSETIDENTEMTENSNSNVQSLVTAEKTEEKLEKKENEPMNPLEDTIVELKDRQMDNANTEENPESVGPLELGSPIVLVAEGKTNETYHEINQTKTDEDKENVNVQILEAAEEKVFLASDKTSEEEISREISQEGQNESEEVEPKSEAEPQIKEAEYMTEAINDDILTEEVLGEAKKAEESEHINEQSEEVGNQVDEAETAPALVEAADNLENEDSLLRSELTTSEHADTNKEATVVANSDMDKIEVEELKICDTELIREITETEVQNIQWKPEASPTAEAPEKEILEGTEKPVNFTISESAISKANTKEENIDESGDPKDEAETEVETSLEGVQLANESTRDMDTASVDTMELQDDSTVILEVSAPKHAEIKECVVEEKSATDEVEDLEISDEKPIIGNTETAELQEVEAINREAEASSTTKAPEEEIIKEVINHGDESETAQETVVTEETSSEGVQQANVSARNLETTAGEYEAVDSLEVQEVNYLELQDSVISQLASTEHADVNKENMVVEELATDEAEVEEHEISKAVTISYGQNDHPINESEKISSVKSSNTNTYKDEAEKETLCELDDKTYTTIPKGEDEREMSIEQPLEESSAPLAAESQIRTTEVSKTIEGKTEIIENFNSNVQSTEEKLEKKENEPMDAIEDTTEELKYIQLDGVNVKELVFREAEKAEESEYTNEHSDENIEEVGNRGDEAETAVDSMEFQNCSVILELTTPEYADINKESLVLEKSATKEVEELKIFDVKPIMGNTETEELQAVEDINQEAEAFFSIKAPEEETAGTIELREVDNMELQDSSEISQPASTKHAEVNKLVVEESATDETEVEELEVSIAETGSYGKIAHQIHESEKNSTGKSSDTNTFDEETSEVLESKSDAEYEVIDEGNNVTEPTHSAEDLTEQFEMSSSETLLREQELQTTATTEEVEDESQMKEETLANEKLESPIATNPKEETCLPESEVKISTLDLELLDKNDSPGESSTGETEDLQEAKAEEPREVLVKSEETEMKEEQTQLEATEFGEKENLEEKLIKEDETNEDDISSKKTTAGTEDDKDSSVASLEVVPIQEELEPAGENKNSTDEGKAAGDTYQDLNADGTDSSSTLETGKDKNVEEAHSRLDLQERDWNDTNVETMSPNLETEVVTAENGEAKKTEDIKEESVEEYSFIRELQTTSASEETTNEIAYADPVRDDKLESKAWSTENKVEELKATEELNLELEASSITETSKKEIKQGTQNKVDITSSVLEVSGEEKIKEAATFNEDIDTQPETIVSETCLEENQEAEKEGSNTENQIEKEDEANDKKEDTHSSEKVADDKGVARKSMATDPTAELSEDLPWIGAQGKSEENVSGAGEVIVNSNQDLVVEGTANENHSQEAAEAKNVNELPREVETQETANQTDCVEIGVETMVPSEEITYSDPVRIENDEATDLTAETEIENLRDEDLSSKSGALANKMSPVVEVQEEDTIEEKLEADINIITDTPPVTLVKETSSEDVQLSEHEIKGSDGTSNDEDAKIKVDPMNQEDEEADSAKHEISSMVTQISREQHAFIGTEEVTAAKLNANETEAEEIITSDRALESIDQDPKDVFETDKVQEEMNSIPDSIAEEKEAVKDSISSASVPIEEEPRPIDAQEKAEIHNEGTERSFVESCPLSVAEGTANENLPQETDKEKNVNKPPIELELQATGEEPKEKAISTEPIILIEENRETVPHEELIATYECVAKDQIDEQIPDTNSKAEDNKDQNLEPTVEKIIGQDFQEVQSEMNKEVGHTLQEENEETQDVKETKKDVFLMEAISQEAVEDIREVEEIVNIKEGIMEGGSCTVELEETSETDENLSEITNSYPIMIENVEEIRSLENESQGIKINSESEESKPMVEKEKLEKADTDVKKESEIINIPDVDEIPVEKDKEQDIEDVQINREITAGVSIGVDKLEERDFETELKYQAGETFNEGGKISDLTHLATNLTEKSRELSPAEMIQIEQNSETIQTVDKVEDESEKKDGTLVTELEEDTLESRTIEAALLSKENPKELQNLDEKCEKDTIQDFQKIEEVLQYLPESPSPNTVTESEVREVEEVHPNPKTETLASVDEENQIQIANEKTRTITKEVSNDKIILDKEVAEDSLLLSADEERISSSCLKDELETLDYPGEITNQKLETTKIRIPAEELSLEHEKAGEIKNIISLGNKNVSEILPEAIKGENEAPTEFDHKDTEDKTVIEESNVSEQDHLIKHETDQAGSTEKNNVSPNYEVRSEDFEADEGEGERKCEEKEEENDENEKVDSGSDGPVMVEIARDVDVKACKKSHGILSGVGSKVKHSISKVKKVITGKSSQKSSPSI